MSQSELCWSLRDQLINLFIMKRKMSQSEFCWSLRDHIMKKFKRLAIVCLNPSYVGVWEIRNMKENFYRVLQSQSEFCWSLRDPFLFWIYLIINCLNPCFVGAWGGPLRREGVWPILRAVLSGNLVWGQSYWISSHSPNALAMYGESFCLSGRQERTWDLWLHFKHSPVTSCGAFSKTAVLRNGSVRADADVQWQHFHAFVYGCLDADYVGYECNTLMLDYMSHTFLMCSQDVADQDVVQDSYSFLQTHCLLVCDMILLV